MASDEISGILNGMLDDMKKSLSEVVQAKADSVAEFEALVAAKEKDIEALGASIASKSMGDPMSTFTVDGPAKAFDPG